MQLAMDVFTTLVPGISSLATEILSTIRRVAPLLKVGEAGPQIQGPDRRLAMGIGWRGSKPTVALLVEDGDSWAHSRAMEIMDENNESVVVSVIGRAHSSRPESRRRSKPGKRVIPGLSIGHYRGFPGTTGCIVRVRNKNEFVGVLSAAHVLSMNNSADSGDPVLQPGSPDGPRVLSNRIGEIADYTYLSHYQESEDEEFPRNGADVGVVKLQPETGAAAANLVPNPRNPDRKMKIVEVEEAQTLFGRIGKKVYKRGRTTGFTTGVLEFTHIKRLPIRLPNGRVYLYDDAFCIKGENKKPFSQPGDSGSLVYTSDGVGLGLIVGGSDRYSFASPLSLCLEEIGAELL